MELQRILDDVIRVFGEVVSKIWDMLMSFRVPTEAIGINDFTGTIMTLLIVIMILAAVVQAASGFLRKFSSVLLTLLLIYMVLLAIGGA